MRLFDLHCDTLTRGVRRHAPFAEWVQTYAAFIPDGLSNEQSLACYESLIATANRWAAESPFDFSIYDNSFARATCTAVLSVENGGALAAAENIFDRFSADGICIVGLTWNGDNAWGSGCSSAQGGLTEAGLLAVAELERRGITVDVSHLSERGFWQLDAAATKPYIASHSNAAAVTPHPRNLTDAQFATIRDRGGLVGLNVYPPFLGDDTLSAFCRHFEHFLSLGGETTVCIGSDIDGFDTPLRTAEYLLTIYEYLTAQGYNKSLIDNLFYNNARRFFDRMCEDNRKEEQL